MSWRHWPAYSLGQSDSVRPGQNGLMVWRAIDCALRTFSGVDVGLGSAGPCWASAELAKSEVSARTPRTAQSRPAKVCEGRRRRAITREPTQEAEATRPVLQRHHHGEAGDAPDIEESPQMGLTDSFGR